MSNKLGRPKLDISRSNRENVLRLRDAGRTFHEIALEIGITTSAAARIAQRLKLPRLPLGRRRDEDKHEKVQAMRESNMTFAQIGAALGMTRQRAQQIWLGRYRASDASQRAGGAN
jgi:predicted transcriptional regulator